MAKFTPIHQDENHQIDFWQVEFTPDDWDAFRASPGKFLKSITEAEGRKVNHLLVDAELLEVDPDGAICHGTITTFHINTGPEMSITGYHCSGHWE
ncbi:hypothetical protein ACH4YO_23390 [Streptomyces noursei]|uniref:hypothetical protein n=1 Tax=Streptomyces noursei TaxID=1971 RepID=UPI0033F3F573